MKYLKVNGGSCCYTNKKNYFDITIYK